MTLPWVQFFIIQMDLLDTSRRTLKTLDIL
jgi:hypothetical protein